MNEPNRLIKPFADAPENEAYIETTAPQQPYLNYGVYTEADDRAQLKDYWRSIRKHKWLVIGLVVLLTTFTTIYMAGKPDVYEAHAQVQVDLENNPALGATKSAPVMLGSQNDPAYFNTQLRLLESSGLLSRVVESLDLENKQFLPAESQTSNSSWQNVLRMVGLGEIEKEEKKEGKPNEARIINPAIAAAAAPPARAANPENHERLFKYVEFIRKRLDVQPVKETRLANKETRLIDVRFIHADAELSAKVVNKIVEKFQDANLEKKTKTNEDAGEFLGKRIAELQSEIRAQDEELNSYASKNQILSLDSSQNTVVERLNSLNRQLLEAENSRSFAEAALQARLAPGALEAQADSTSRQTAEAEGRLAQLQQQREELLVENTEEAPPIVALDRQIAVLEKQIADTRQRAVAVTKANLETTYREAAAKEQALRAAFEKQRRETVTQNEAAILYTMQKKEVDTKKEMLSVLMQRARENEVMMAGLLGTPNNIHIVERAIVPKEPIGPRRWLAVSLAFLFSLSCGVGLAVFLGYLDDTVNSADEAEKMLRLPVLAMVPLIGGVRQRRLLPGVGAWRQRSRKGEAPLVTADTRSPLAEAYRRLRTSVLLSTAGHPPKTLLVTSSLPDEGKTTTAVNMALTLANSGDKVLIIDADMHRPSLHSVFGMENRDGLSTALVQEMDETKLMGIIETYEESNLHVLLTGPVPPNPAELLGSKQMRNLMGILESQFTYIIIDSPPITYFTDSVLLTSLVDGVLLVVNSGKTSREIVRRSRKALKDVNARIFGVVLNNVHLKPQDYSY